MLKKEQTRIESFKRDRENGEGDLDARLLYYQ
jgi:hypothetical protein